jgi:hypothetical protein
LKSCRGDGSFVPTKKRNVLLDNSCLLRTKLPSELTVNINHMTPITKTESSIKEPCDLSFDELRSLADELVIAHLRAGHGDALGVLFDRYHRLVLHVALTIHESLKLQFRAEMFNVLNHPNFAPPISDLTDGQFGLSTQTLGQSLGGDAGGGGLSTLYQIGGPRSIQLALKLLF